ncbi:alpha-2,8-sialyltransferase 8F [Thalassophryne amazonica]|uniref:alpha-2,8-sialyltransferase 8F n=1 Tax=Thalassophryne amazonica TaxID=390379 RepID=UPI001470E301|nr:alpha-2,8-sialyltransferase 8F [Thalassophryne amazonica]
MRRTVLKSLLSLMITVIFVVTFLTTLIWYIFNDSNVGPHRLHTQRKNDPKPSDTSKACREDIKKAVERYSQPWKKEENNLQKFRSQLSSRCHGLSKAIITQANTPVGTKIVYDGERRKAIQVTPEIFSTFAKVHPFLNKTWDTCAVVGNGGILVNSSCGDTIDSAQFVIRCNLPPLKNGYKKHVGSKTDLVTANPSIFLERYGGLLGRRRTFVENLHTYGDALLLLPAFSFGHNTPVSLRVLYTIEDFGSPTQAFFFNPQYLQSLAHFWRSQGLRTVRLSTGIIMASLALELCTNVHLYGFWPFPLHPHDLRPITNHYYDNRPTNKKFHTMPAEFNHLLQLHTEGVLRIHLEDCQSNQMQT